jgi:hypothetical protein
MGVYFDQDSHHFFSCRRDLVKARKIQPAKNPLVLWTECSKGDEQAFAASGTKFIQDDEYSLPLTSAHICAIYLEK